MVIVVNNATNVPEAIRKYFFYSLRVLGAGLLVPKMIGCRKADMIVKYGVKLS